MPLSIVLWLPLAAVLLGSFAIDFGREAAARLACGKLPDAVVCGSDLIALGAVRDR